MHKIAVSKEGCFIYPTPVEQLSKHLIFFECDWEARLFVLLLNQSFVASPILNASVYTLLRTHSDGKAKVYSLEDKV